MCNLALARDVSGAGMLDVVGFRLGLGRGTDGWIKIEARAREC